jgi:recombination protein RecA
VGSRVKVKVVKNKVAPPFRQAEFDILFGGGISREGDVLDLAVELGVVKKSGSFYSYGEQRLGQGREATREYLKAHPELLDQLEREVRALRSVPVRLSTSTPEEGESRLRAAEEG